MPDEHPRRRVSNIGGFVVKERVRCRALPGAALLLGDNLAKRKKSVNSETQNIRAKKTQPLGLGLLGGGWLAEIWARGLDLPHACALKAGQNGRNVGFDSLFHYLLGFLLA